VLFAVVALLGTACGEAPDAVAAKREAELVITHARVITVDDAFTIADTVVVDEGRIAAVGGPELLERWTAPEVLDLEGRALMPGFVDAHIHIRGTARRHVALAGTSSIAELQARVEARARALGPGEWITGYGWSEDELADGRKPDRRDLDAVAPDNPVVLTRAGGHSAVANSRALLLGEIDAATDDPDGGVIERDAQGVPTGVIRERQDLLTRLVPAATEAELEESLVEALEALLPLGITSIVDAAKQPEDWPRWVKVYAQHRGELPRAAVQMLWPGAEAMAALREQDPADEHLRLGPIKVFADGGFTGPAAFTTEPYVGQGDYRGYLTRPEPELVALLDEIHDAGWQMGVHAIGDAAIEIVAQTLAEVLERNPRENHRHYLNHFSMRPTDATMDLMAQHGIAITQQPNFTYTLEGRYVANLDGWRLEHNNPVRSPMEHGIHVALSSDILPIGPLVGLYGAVTRKGMSGRVFAEEEAITMPEAIRAYTRDAAWITFEEDEKGSIEVGKLADMIELSEDLLTIPPERIMDVQVLRTWLGGRLVHARD
jgi:predicted amidohydrolase YtcJ